MIRGLNHLTLAVTDLDRALKFYKDRLGFRLRAHWPAGAYLDAGSLWLCLSVDGGRQALQDYSHVALDVDAADFAGMATALADVPRWRDNRSEGASLYLLDPDGHRLELHVGTLATRIAAYRREPPADMVLYD